MKNLTTRGKKKTNTHRLKMEQTGAGAETQWEAHSDRQSWHPRTRAWRCVSLTEKLTVREPGLCAANALDQQLRLLSDLNRHDMAHVSGSILSLPHTTVCLSHPPPTLPPHTQGKEAENLHRHVIREDTGMGDDYMKKCSASAPMRKWQVTPQCSRELEGQLTGSEYFLHSPEHQLRYLRLT